MNNLRLSLVFCTSFLSASLLAVQPAPEMKNDLNRLKKIHAAIIEDKAKISDSIALLEELDDGEDILPPLLGTLSDKLTELSPLLTNQDDKDTLDALTTSMAELYVLEDIAKAEYQAKLEAFFTQLETLLTKTERALEKKIEQQAPPVVQRASEIQKQLQQIRSDLQKLTGPLKGITDMPAFVWYIPEVEKQTAATRQEFIEKVLAKLAPIITDPADKEMLSNIREEKMKCLFYPSGDPLNRYPGDAEDFFASLNKLIDTLEQKAKQS